MKNYLIAASALVLAATSAQAADVVTTYANEVQIAPVAAADGFSFDGFYVGGQMGGSWAQNKFKATVGKYHDQIKAKPDGFIGGLYAGYNFTVYDNVVLGVETDFNFGNVDGVAIAKDREVNIFGTGSTLVKQKWSGSTRLRAAYAVDRWLPYVTAGIAYSQLHLKGAYAFRSEFHYWESSYEVSKTKAGWTAGAGVDYAVTDNILVRAEYRYTDFGKFKEEIDYEWETGKASSKFSSNEFRIGVAYKF